MSDAPRKTFSDILNQSFSQLMLCDLKNPPIPNKVIELLTSIKPILDDPTECNGVTLSFGKPGNPSEIIRSVAGNVFEFHLNMAFPFQLTPIRDDVRSGCVMLQTSAEVNYPAVTNGFLDRKALAEWLHDILSNVTSGWNLCDFHRNFSLQSDRQDFRVICLPVLEFKHSQWPLEIPGVTANGWSLQTHPWYAVPQATRPLDSRSFVVWVPDWERCILNTHQHSQRLFRLVEDLADRYDVKIKDFDLVIKTVMLHEVHNLPRELGDSMITLVEAVLARLQEGKLNRFLVESINVLQTEEDSVLEQNHLRLKEALSDLKEIKFATQKVNGSNVVIVGNEEEEEEEEEGEGYLYLY